MPRRNRRGGRRGGGGNPVLEFEISQSKSFTVSTTNYVDASFSDVGVPLDRPCRIVRVTGEVVMSSGSTAALQLSIFGPPSASADQAIVARTPVMAAGVAPRRVSCVAPKSTDYWSPSSSSNAFRWLVASGWAGTGEASTTAHYTFAGRIAVQFERKNNLKVLPSK